MNLNEKNSNSVARCDMQVFCDTALFRTFYWVLTFSFSLMCAGKATLLFPGLFAALLVVVLLETAAVFLWFALEKMQKEHALKILCALFSFACIGAMSFHTLVDRNLGWFISYVLFAVFLFYALRRPSLNRVRIASLTLSIFLSFAVFIGTQLEKYDRIEVIRDVLHNGNWSSLFTSLFCIAGSIFFFTVALTLFFSYFLDIDHSKPRESAPRYIYIYIYMLIILLCWLPYFYAFYPANFTSDPVYELQQLRGVIPPNNHQPYIHQLLIGLCLKLGGNQLDSGMAIYTAVQMLLLSFSFSLCVWFLSWLGVKRWLRLLVLATFALSPMHAFYSITVWKDIPFAAITLIFIILLISQSASATQSRRAAIFIALLTVLFGFLFCVFRNNGWYAFLLGFPIYILFNRKNWKKLCPIFLLVILLVSGYNRLIFDVLGVAPSPRGEMLSVPLQQLARVAKDRPEELDSEEYIILEEVIVDIDTLGDRYISHISDSVKGADNFDGPAFDRDPLRYAKCWLRVGLRHPLTYLEAFMLQNYGYWYPDTNYWVISLEKEEASAEHWRDLGLDESLMHNSKTRDLRYELFMLANAVIDYSPLSILFSIGFVVWLLVLSAFLLYFKGRTSLLSPLSILAMLWLTTLASPVYCEFRYLYGLAVCVPMYVALAVGLKKQGSI